MDVEWEGWWESLAGPQASTWSVLLVFLSTTTSTSSPAGLLLSLLVATRPPALLGWWSSLCSSPPLLLLGLHLPLVVLAVYWLHGLLLLLLDLLPHLTLSYKIQPSAPLITRAFHLGAK